MTRNIKLTTWGLLATLAAASVAPALADDQSDKNNMRNLTIAGAGVALYGLFNHNSTATLLGAAGAALAGSQYEKDRKDQSQDNSWRNDRRYYYRDGRNDNNSRNWNNNRTENNSDRSGNNGGQNSYRYQDNKQNSSSQQRDHGQWDRH